MLKLGILDQSPLAIGGTAVEAFRQTLQLAGLADRLGYTRYWVAEHHDTPGLAGSAPEVLISAIAAQTSRIRVGSGGVLLSHYSPYKVAETFRVLEALYPGRIDLGIGRAPGGMPIATKALRYGRPKEQDSFETALRDLGGFLHDRLPEEHPLNGLQATPLVEGAPDVWLLGSSNHSSKVAAEMGAGFVFAHFISSDGGIEAVREYVQEFCPGPFGEKPRVSACVHVLCAETDEEAERLARPLDLRFLLFEQGQFRRPFPTLEEAESYPYSDWDLGRIRENRKRVIIGGPDSVKEQLERFADDYGTDELLVVTITGRFEDRLKSYERLSRLWL